VIIAWLHVIGIAKFRSKLGIVVIVMVLGLQVFPELFFEIAWLDGKVMFEILLVNLIGEGDLEHADGDAVGATDVTV